MKTKNKKIFFFLNNLGPGGSENILSKLANYFSKKNNVTLFKLRPEVKDFYKIKKNIKIRNIFFFKKKIIFFIPSFFKLREIFKKEKPDLIVSFNYVPNILIIISTLFLNIPIIVSERVHPKFSIDRSFFWNFLNIILLRFANQIIVQTIEIKKYFYNLYIRNTHIIPNFITKRPINNRYKKKKLFL